MRNRLRAFIAAAAFLPAAAACGDWIAGPSISNWGDGGGGGSFDYPLTITGASNLLTGDSARVSVWASSADPKSTWELTGPAVFVLGTGAVATRIALPVSDVWIRATGSGAVSVKAVRHGVDSAATSFYIADPAEVTLRIVQGRDLSIRVAGEGWVVAHLYDSENRYYDAAFEWSSSDTNAVILGEDGYHSQCCRFAHGQSVGSARVVIAYREQRDTATVSVVP